MKRNVPLKSGGYLTIDQTEAMTMGDRIVVMNNGVIEQIDLPEMIYKKPANIFTSTFIGTPQINLIEGELKQKDSEWLFISKEFSLYIEKSHYQYSNLKEGKVVFAIRSENIHYKRFVDIKDDRNIINANVDFLEYLGSEIIMHLFCGYNKFSVRFNQIIESDKTKSVQVLFDVSQGHFFNIKTRDIL